MGAAIDTAAASVASPPTARWWRVLLRSGIAFFIAKGCLWLVVAAWFHHAL